MQAARNGKHVHTYLPPNPSNEVLILVTAIAVGENGHLVFLTRGHIEHCYLVGLTAIEREGEREGGREREGRREGERERELSF